ncbi:MAG: 2-isopropylmalate synthase [Chitinispirillaceae bacterium]
MSKYGTFPHVEFSQRTWPSKVIDKAPVWCSVDLRDGNQALVDPMTSEQKLHFFRSLTDIGFREIEISFPSASKADYDFTRTLIEEGHIPGGVSIQVLTQAREHLIEKTLKAVDGASRTILHMYNSTSPAQREIVFRKSAVEVISLAVDGVKMIRDRMSKVNGEIVLQYSPESFSQTEVSFACDICSAVMEAWAPGENEKVIINLPSTVEVASPHIFADQVEYMNKHVAMREHVILGVHTHNDRGCAVAAAEMAQLAGAERVEGTLFGNGERTGNADLVTLALNCQSQGVDPGLDFRDLQKVQKAYTEYVGMDIAPRHPYAGELVFTAFSGSHQDAISKGLAHYRKHKGEWNVPYLPIDPTDIGRSYEAVIRINSQSGKGGAAYIMEHFHGYTIPREMHPEFGMAVQKMADEKGRELQNPEVFHCFEKEYLNVKGRYDFEELQVKTDENGDESDHRHLSVGVGLKMSGKQFRIEGKGNGVIDALVRGLGSFGTYVKVVGYSEHSLGEGSQARAASYIQLEDRDGNRKFGAGVDTDIACSSVKALFSALNRLTAE